MLAARSHPAANTDTDVDACAGGSGADVITVPAGTYTLTLGGADEEFGATGDLDITAGLTIDGAGAATTIIDGGPLTAYSTSYRGR